MPRSIGVLYDSAHDNTGDRAIGAAMAQFIADRGATPRILDPLGPGKVQAPVVVGGGELIREPGDPFYDVFRLSGAHILNATGVDSSEDLDYLGEYEYASVRSKLDYDRIRHARPDAEVVPCVAASLEPAPPPRPAGPDTVVLHFHEASIAACPDLVDILSELVGLELRWMSITPYNGDLAGMLRVGSAMAVMPETDPARTPAEKMAVIGGARLLISSSLHGAIFAHIQNVPFLVWSGAEKIRAFLEDRGLEERGFGSSEELRAGIARTLDSRPDFSTTIDADTAKLDEHLARVADLLGLPKKPQRRTGPAKGRLSAPGALEDPVRSGGFVGFDRTLDRVYIELRHLARTVYNLYGVRRQLQDESQRLQVDRDRWRERAEGSGIDRDKWAGRTTELTADRDRWKERGEALEADRDRWKERAAHAERRYRAREEAVAAIGKELENARAELDAAKAIQGQMSAVESVMNALMERRVEERMIRRVKRAAKGAWRVLPDGTKKKLRPTAERAAAALGRPVPALEPGPDAQPEDAAAAQPQQPGALASAEPQPEAAFPVAYPRISSFPAVPNEVSVLLPTFNAGPAFEQTLRAIAAQRGVGGIELIVVDSSSTDGTAELAKEFGADVHVIETAQYNHGATRNQLAQYASHDFLLFTVQDAVLLGDYALRDLTKFLLENPTCAAVSARQVPRADADLFASFGGFTHESAMEWDADRVTGPVDPSVLHSLPLMKRRQLAALDNVCCALRREVWESLHFRPMSFAEDLEFAQRCVESGWAIGHMHSVAVAHSHNRPAVYHLRRHLIDRLTVAQLLSDPTLDTVSLGTPAEVAAAVRMMLRATDEVISGIGRKLLSDVLKTYDSLLAKLMGIEDGRAKTDGLDAELANGELVEIDELLAPVGSDLESGAEALYGLMRGMRGFLAQPHLHGFARANQWCGREQAGGFVAKITAVVCGTAVGNAISVHGVADETAAALTAGI